MFSPELQSEVNFSLKVVRHGDQFLPFCGGNEEENVEKILILYRSSIFHENILLLLLLMF